MSNSQEIIIACNQGVMKIGINRPEKKNALTRSMYDLMRQALIAAQNDPDIKVVLLHGTTKSFSAGNDLGDFERRNLNEPSPAALLLEVVHDFTKPIVAAVSGVAVGIGVTLLLHCDLVYASPNTRFRLPFVNLGVCPEAGSSMILPLVAGHRLAAELLMLGEFFSTKKAIEAGIVNVAVADENLMDVATSTAMKLAHKPTKALMTTKWLMKKGQHQMLKTQMNEEFLLFNQLLDSPESIAIRKNLC